MIEIIVVIAIMAMSVGLAVSLIGASTSSKIKEETSRLIRTIQFAYNDSVSRRFPLRIVFDIDNGEYWLESGSEDFLLESVEVKESKKKVKPSEETSDDEELQDAPSFTAEDTVIKKVKLPSVIKIQDVYVLHQDALVTTGQAYLYFFPNGQTEFAVIHLMNEEETMHYTVVVNPVTGRSKVTAEYEEYEKILEE